MNENEYRYMAQGLLEAVIEACAKAGEAFGADPLHLAKIVCSTLLLSVTASEQKDSALITVRKNSDGESWSTHIHMDYLDADPDHLARDFQIPNARDNEMEECRD